jgi:hypothetical protein
VELCVELRAEPPYAKLRAELCAEFRVELRAEPPQSFAQSLRTQSFVQSFVQARSEFEVGDGGPCTCVCARCCGMVLPGDAPVNSPTSTAKATSLAGNGGLCNSAPSATARTARRSAASTVKPARAPT